jgi:hypothetical protein
MHKTISLVAIAIALIALIGWAAQGCVDKKHKYEIEYGHGKWGLSDFTDSFVLDGSIRYINEHGDSVHRFGTFSVSNNRDYQK